MKYVHTVTFTEDDEPREVILTAPNKLRIQTVRLKLYEMHRNIKSLKITKIEEREG